jgi:hypothetical protein
MSGEDLLFWFLLFESSAYVLVMGISVFCFLIVWARSL